MKRASVSVLAAVLTLAAAIPAGATESRANSLVYNLAFEDDTDIFMFPQLLPRYQGLYLQLPQAISNVYGGLVYNFSNQSSLAVFVHRAFTTSFDQYRLSSLDVSQALDMVRLAPMTGGAAQQQHLAGQLFDIMYGTGTWGVGLRMHLWSETSQQDAPLADPAEAQTAITAELNGGFRLMDSLDLGMAFAFRNVKDNYFMMSFRLGGRYLEASKAKVRPVFAGQLEFGLAVPDQGDSSFSFLLPLKGGVRLAVIPGLLDIGLLGGLEIQMVKQGGQDTRFGLVAPVVEIASELKALEWLYLRTGIKGGYGVQFAGDPGDNNPKHEQLGFSSGLGFVLGPFNVDAVIQYSLWQNGPWIIGGTAGLFAGVTLSYLWGRPELAERAAKAVVREVMKPRPKPRPVENKQAVKTESSEAKPVQEAKPEEKKPASDTGSTDSSEFEGWE
ncbi:MAG: hypothetical protein D6806_07345 [Deltaproteobacteria bacterium]|nr:MAG: hypothetical protein D6806_07345 [Deltaproteobacteria bacterium]